MPRQVPLPPHLVGASFLTADTRLNGVSRARLRGRDVAHPFRGVSTVGLELDTTFGRAMAYEPLLGTGQFFSHETAAELFGMPLPFTDGSDAAGLGSAPHDVRVLHVSVLGVRTPPRHRGVIGHALTAADVATTLLFGLLLIAPADTWCHLAPVLCAEDLVAVGDFLLSGRRRKGGREPALATPQQLAAAVERHAGRRGARALRWALPRLRSGVDSRPESRLRLLLVAAGLPEPTINAAVPVEAGLVLHPDLCYSRWRVVFEYEGDGHRVDRRQFRGDIERRELFESAGWRVIRVTADDLFLFRERLIARVRRILREREGLHPASSA